MNPRDRCVLTVAETVALLVAWLAALGAVAYVASFTGWNGNLTLLTAIIGIGALALAVPWLHAAREEDE